MWKPIDTAPKDGRSVLLFITPDCIVSGNNDLNLLGSTAPRDEWWHVSPDGIAYPIEGPPTHWMPLPSPPETDQKGPR